ncbi:hypothetical protein RQP46_009545 [Phenoliferia psychrophenolica]
MGQTFLPWVGTSPLPELSLPIHNTFNIRPRAFERLRMPNLRKLSLSTDPTVDLADRSDLLTSLTFPSLSTFLTPETFPGLKTLRLVGWLDKSGIATLATLPPSQLVVRHLYVFGLLGLLKFLGAVELILENSEGHPDEEEICVFEREEEGEWTKISGSLKLRCVSHKLAEPDGH